MFYFPRGGNRGGSDQFKWDDVKTDKHREFYLGHSVKAPVGRWQEGKDLAWYAKDKNEKQSTMKKEFDSVRNAEKEAMMIALGQIPPKTGNDESSTTKKCGYEQQHKHKLKKDSSESKQSSKKKKKKRKKERREKSDSSSSEEEEKRPKKRKHHKHRYHDHSDSDKERERKDKKKKKNYSDNSEIDRFRLKYETSRKAHKNDSESRDVRDRARKCHGDGKHKTLRREYRTDSNAYSSSSSERELKRRRNDRRRNDEKKNKY